MTDKKYYLWLIPGVLALGLVLALMLTFQPVFAGSSQTGQQSFIAPDEVLAPQVEVDPACTLETTASLAIAYWPLNETSGTTFDNALSASHDGTCSGGSCPSPVSGTNAGGQFFIDTDGDGITVPSNAAFDFLPADPFSVGVWVKTTQSCDSNKVYLGRYGSAEVEGRWWLGCVSGGSPGVGVAQFHMRDSTYFNSGIATGVTQINDGEWHYLTGVWDGTDTILYVDGVEDATESSPGFTGNFNSTKPVTIGIYDNKYNALGALDEAAVFDSALSSTFINDYMDTCAWLDLNVGDVTFDTSKNVAIPITSAELYANSIGTGSLSITSVDSTSAKGGTISGTAPAGPFTYTPPTDYSGTDFFTFVVSDGTNTAEGTAIITQEKPEVTNPGPQADFEGAAVSLQIVATDPNGDTLSYAASGLPGGLSINVDTGLISGNVAAGAASGSPYDPVTVTVTDNKGFATSVEFTWTISINNLPPIVADPGNQTNFEGDLVSLQISASDPNGDPLTYKATNLPPGLSINASSGLISGEITVGANNSSPYTVTVIAEDLEPLSGQVTFTWTVNLPANNIFLPGIFNYSP